MPSTTFTYPHASLITSGQVVEPSGFAGQLYNFALGSTLDTICVGTDATIRLYGLAVSIVVDGGSATTVNPPGGTWTNVPLFSGLSDSAHSVTVTCTADNSNTYMNGTFTTGGTVTVTGAAPALQTPSGFGPQYPVAGTAFSAASSQEGGWVNTNVVGYTNLRYMSFSDGMMRWYGKASTLKVWMVQHSMNLRFQIDGVDQGLVTAPSANVYGWVTLATGLDPTTTHEYGFTCGHTPENYIYSVMFVGGDLVAHTYVARPKLATYGDSITMLGDTGDSTIGYSHLVGMQNGLAVYQRGIGSSTVKHFSSGIGAVTTNAGETRTSDITSQSPDAVVILYGTNDLGQVGGAETQAEFQTAYQNMLTALLAGTGSGCGIYCVGILPRSAYSLATVAAWNTYLQAAITAVGNSRLHYVDSSGWGLDNGGNYSTYFVDGLHPNAAGHAVIAARLAPLLPTTAPPGTPTGLTAPTTAAVAVSWTSVTGAAGYKLYRNGSQVYDGTSTSYTDSVAVGAAASYTVLAYNSSGSSAQSSAVVATTGGGGGLLITMQGGFTA